MSSYYLISLICFICGVILKVYPSLKNDKIGYKSTFAMKNIDTWKEANSFSSLMLIISSILSSIFSFIFINVCILPITLKSKICTLSTVLIILIFVFYTEIHLRRIFNKDGSKKIKLEYY